MGDADGSTTSSPLATLTFNPKLQLPATCDPPTPQNPPEQRVWIVFGATGHVGRSVAKAALSHGDLVTAVGRTHENTLPSVASSFQSFSDRCLPHLCDVRLRPTVDAVIQQSITHWGRVDIIANCTGYGVIGACEDQDDYDIRNQFETNFFGTLNIIHASLPYFRTRHSDPRPPSANNARYQDLDNEEEEEEEGEEEEEPIGGRYIIFSSTSGALGIPGLGPYCATKHAVEGLIESMLYEVHAFNIKATLVEPGYLRRDDDSSSSPPLPPPPPPPPSSTDPFPPQTSSPSPQDPPPQQHPATYTHFLINPPPAHSPYADPLAPAGHARRMVQCLGHPHHAPTSTTRSAELVWQLGHCRFPPLRLLLGGFAVESVRDRLRCVIEEIEDWRFLGFGGTEGEQGEQGAVVEEGRRRT
ncbi:MAG: hypothetical protein Q9202_007239 [Teloschistes flavicans]